MLIRASSGGGTSNTVCKYIGTGSQGSTASKTFNISSVYSDYANLTVSNFLICYLYQNGNQAIRGTGINRCTTYYPNVSYNSSTGVLSVTAPQWVDNTGTVYYGYKVYLIVDPT